MDTSPNTAIGMFDDYAEAERVAQDLTRAGIPRESVEVRSNFMTGAAGRSQPAQTEKEGGISGFFHRLFGGNEDEYSDHYAEAIRRGSTVVCVTAPADRIDDAATNDFRRDYDDRFAKSGVPYETMQPAYKYGYRAARDPRYKDRKWSDVEQTLKTDYMRNNPNSSWDRVNGAVRYGWEKVTGKR